MADLKTKKNDGSTKRYLRAIEDPVRRADCMKMYDLMADITGEDGSMWGDRMIGFGSYHYKYASGREGDWFLTGFSNRKDSISIYILPGFSKYKNLMEQLGKHKTGKSCLYVKQLSDINLDILKKLIKASVKHMNQTYNSHE